VLRIVRPEFVGFALGALALGAAVLANGVYRRRRWRPTAAWRRAPAEVTHAGVLTANDLLGPGNVSDRVPRVAYAYAVGGRSYTGVLAGGSVTLDYAGVRPTPSGLEAVAVRPAAFDVLYDPDRPEWAVPEWHTEIAATVCLVAGAALLLVGAALATAALTSGGA
jgi:hypothetical protein